MNRIIDPDDEARNSRQHIVYGVGSLFCFVLASSSSTCRFMDGDKAPSAFGARQELIKIGILAMPSLI